MLSLENYPYFQISKEVGKLEQEVKMFKQLNTIYFGLI